MVLHMTRLALFPLWNTKWGAFPNNQVTKLDLYCQTQSWQLKTVTKRTIITIKEKNESSPYESFAIF